MILCGLLLSQQRHAETITARSDHAYCAPRRYYLARVWCAGYCPGPDGAPRIGCTGSAPAPTTGAAARGPVPHVGGPRAAVSPHLPRRRPLISVRFVPGLVPARSGNPAHRGRRPGQARAVVLTRLMAATAVAVCSAVGGVAPYFTKCRGTTRSVGGYLLKSSLPHTGQVSTRRLVLRGPAVPEHSIRRRVMWYLPACHGQVRSWPLSFPPSQIHARSCPVHASIDMYGYGPYPGKGTGLRRLQYRGCRPAWDWPRHESGCDRSAANT